MKITLSSRALLGVLFVLAALVGTPIAIFQLQQQQEIRQRADTTIAWTTAQSASSVCTATGAAINVTFSNTEPTSTSLSMDVIVKDGQTGKSISLGSIPGGQTKSGVIATNQPTISSGTVTFSLKWTDGHTGVDSRTATYKAVSTCVPPTPTITIKPTTGPSPTLSPKPSLPINPSPTICPTLGPVKNVKIDCPNCPK